MCVSFSNHVDFTWEKEPLLPSFAIFDASCYIIWERLNTLKQTHMHKHTHSVSRWEGVVQVDLIHEDTEVEPRKKTKQNNVC